MNNETFLALLVEAQRIFNMARWDLEREKGEISLLEAQQRYDPYYTLIDPIKNRQRKTKK